MPALSIDASPVSVLSARDVTRKLTYERMHDGSLVGSRPGATDERRMWEIAAGVYTSRATAEAFASGLEAPGTVTASGDLIGGSISARADNVNVERASRPDHLVVLFTLVEVP